MDTIHQICCECRKLTLERISNASTCQLKIRVDYPEKEQDHWELALGLKTPISFNLSHLRSSYLDCRICALLYQQLDTTLFTHHDILEGYLSKDLEGKLQNLWFYVQGSMERVALLDLYQVEESPNAHRLLFRPIAEPGSDKSITRVREWIRHCNANHPRCLLDISGAYVLTPPRLPTRVIDVNALEKDVRLLVSNGRYATYIALSHCWGGASLVRTTKALFLKHEQCIKYDSLSRTLRDAVYVTRKLGIQYLWVDSLCIIQDDEADWSREAKSMALVYEGAYMTIAATSAKDGTQGLFPPRLSQTLVKVPCNPADHTSGSMYLGIKDQTAIYEMFKGPLNNRAWVLQERLFSRRIVHFAGDQLYWDCDKGLMAEDNELTTDPQTEALQFRFIPTRSMLCYILYCYLGKTQNPLPEPVATDEKPFGTTADFHNIDL